MQAATRYRKRAGKLRSAGLPTRRVPSIVIAPGQETGAPIQTRKSDRWLPGFLFFSFALRVQLA